MIVLELKIEVDVVLHDFFVLTVLIATAEILSLRGLNCGVTGQNMRGCRLAVQSKCSLVYTVYFVNIVRYCCDFFSILA